MAFISKSDLKLVTFMNRKYSDYNVKFKYYDDYIIWLFEEYCESNEEDYYSQFEKDIEEYSNFQTGRQRDKEGKLDGDWEKD